MPTSEQTKTPRRSRWRTWAGRVALGAAACFALVVAVVFYVLGSLDAPWLKTRLQTEVRGAANLEVDWAHAQLSLFSGLVLEDVRVRSPAALQARAPDFVHVGRLEATWSVRRLWKGEGPLLDTVLLQTLEVAVIDDAQRGSTFSLLWPASPAAATPPEKPAGLSMTLRSLFGSRPYVGAGRVEGVALSYRKVDKDQVVDEAALEGLSLRLDGWHAQLGSGPAAPLAVRAMGHSASLRVALDADASAEGVTLHAETDIESQDFEPALHPEQLLRLDARANFEPNQLTVKVTRAVLMDGTANATAGLDYADDGKLVVRSAEVKVDAPRACESAAALGVPVSVVEGSVALSARDVRALPSFALEKLGELVLRAGLSGFERRQGEAVDKVAKAAAEVRFAQTDGKPGLGFKVSAEGLAHAAASVKSLRLEGTFDQAPAGWGGNATVSASDVVATREARVANLDLGLRLDDVGLAPGALVPVRARAGLKGTVNGVRYMAGALRADFGDGKFSLEAATEGRPPFAATVDVQGHLRLGGANAKLLFDGPAHVAVTAREVEPSSLSGAALAQAELADAELKLDARKTGDAAQLQATLQAKSLALLEPLVALPAGWRVAWGRASASVTTHAQVEALSAAQPRLTHATTLEVKDVEATTPRGPMAVGSLQAVLDARGTAQVHAGTLKLDCRACASGAVKLAEERLAVTFDVDRQAPRAKVQLDAQGTDGPELKALVTAGYVKKEDRTQAAVELTLGRLAALAPLLHGTGAKDLDLAQLGATLHARGSVPGKALVLGAAEGSAEAEVTGVSWEEGDRWAQVPALALTAKLGTSDAGQAVEATVAIAQLQAAAGEKTATVSGLALAAQGLLARGSQAATGKVDLSLKDVEQDFVPAYPVGGVKLSATGARDAAGMLTLGRSTFVNLAAGTSLWFEGAMAPDPTHPKANARAELTQDMALAWRDAKQFQGKGTAVLKLNLHSADLRLFQTTGGLALAGADVRVPGAVAEGIEGELPFALDFVLDAKGLRPVRNARVNPYALLRFQDQHPLLKAQSFLTVRKLVTPQVTVAPLAANVQVSQGVLYLSQLEMGVSGGAVTGELLVDLNEKDPRVRANVRATGIRSEGGDVFTGNAALAISLRDHSVDGRAEVLQISKRQLLALLDLYDPRRTMASANRIRGVMDYGYPDRLHILFNHGFASAKVTFGGAASLVQLDELRGIPVESLLDRYLFKASTKEDP